MDEEERDCLPACSKRYCMITNLRLTPSGPFCKAHYIKLPPCMEPGCEEPVVEAGQCRDHWLDELPPLDLEAETFSNRCALGHIRGPKVEDEEPPAETELDDPTETAEE